MSTHLFTLAELCQERVESQVALMPGVQWDKQHAPDGTTSHDGGLLTLSDVLRKLVTVLTFPAALEEMLHSVAVLIKQAMQVDLCVILLVDRDCTHLEVRMSVPDLAHTGVLLPSIPFDYALLARLQEAMTGGYECILVPHEQALLSPLKNVRYETLLPVPLIAGAQCAGLLLCYTSEQRIYSNEDLLLMSTVVGQAALAIKHVGVVEADTRVEKNIIKAFFDELLSDTAEITGSLHRRASFLGYDVAKPQIIMVIDVSQGIQAQEHHGHLPVGERLALNRRVMEYVKQHINIHFPRSLLDERGTNLVCLFHLDADGAVSPQSDQWFDTLAQQIQRQYPLCLSAGVGNVCREVKDYRRGYAEALEALELGHVLNRGGHMTHFNALGVYRYIYTFARTDTLGDQYQNQVASIADYDRRRNAHLLDTMEIYLECGGNSAKVCEQLTIHRNTLLQRLERLRSLGVCDLEQHEHRLPLLVALKVHKLRGHTALD